MSNVKRQMSALLLPCLFLVGCGADLAHQPFTPLRIEVAQAGTTVAGAPVDLFTLRNGKGSEMTVLTVGATLRSLMLVKGEAPPAVVFANEPALAAFAETTPVAGSTTALIDGVPTDWHQTVWDSEPFQTERGVGVVLSKSIRDSAGDPSHLLRASVTYTLTFTNELFVEYAATAVPGRAISLTMAAPPIALTDAPAPTGDTQDGGTRFAAAKTYR
jgi:galactose mutarotase-like enzyme